MAFDSDLTLHQKETHVPNFDPTLKNNLTNIIFSPFTQDNRKTSWYTHTMEDLKPWDHDNNDERLKEWVNEKVLDGTEIHFFNVHKYKRRLKSIRIRHPKVLEVELAAIYSNGGMVTIQKYSEDTIDALNIEHMLYKWFSAIRLRDSLPLHSFEDGVQVILKVKIEKDCYFNSINAYGEFIRISEYEVHHSVNKNRGDSHFQIMGYCNNDEMMPGDVIYGFKLKNKEDSNIIFMHDKEELLNCHTSMLKNSNTNDSYSLEEIADWLTYDPAEKDLRYSGLMWSQSLSINKSVVWLIGRMVKI